LIFSVYKIALCVIFVQDQSHCTDTGYRTVEDRNKPLFLKEIKKLWDKEDPSLPWEKGDYNESNTILMDDSPHKALRNPPYTGVFPYPYLYKDNRDNLLARKGKLRLYLERLVKADNVQKFVSENRFGQRPITKSDVSWPYYSKIFYAAGSTKPENNKVINDREGEQINDDKQKPHSEASISTSEVEEIYNFTQDDLLTEDTLILDTHAEVFVWVGHTVDPKEKQKAFEMGEKYIALAASLEGLPQQVSLYKITEGNEPCFFTTYFSWDSAKAIVQGNSFQKKVMLLFGISHAAEVSKQIRCLYLNGIMITKLI
ncbi:hypothetical protein V2J09_023058, partial [Rumex salicifolius]